MFYFSCRPERRASIPAGWGKRSFAMTMPMTQFHARAARRGFTLVELLVVIAIIGTLVGLLLPAVQSAREAARRSGCSFNIRGLTQAIMVYESTKRRLPAATDRSANTSTAGNGTEGDAGSGYSWLFHILPYMEEGAFYNNVVANTQKLELKPFNALTTSGQNQTGIHAATVQIAQLVCPSFGGGTSCETSNTGSTSGLSYSSEYGTAEGNLGGPIAVTNYKAMAGTHLNTAAAGAKVANMPSDNGALVFYPDQAPPSSTAAADLHKKSLGGVKQGSISDGMSKTVLVAESNERGYASWIDGTTAWVVAYDPNEGMPFNVNGIWSTAANSQTPITTTGLNYEASLSPARKYLPAGSFRASGMSQGMAYGPGSDHQGGIAMHAFGDTHVTQITGEIDPVVYMAICSRNGNEANSIVE
jgi:prepilin-type N-terminal cleavage/methylation domain-containing protein